MPWRGAVPAPPRKSRTWKKMSCAAAPRTKPKPLTSSQRTTVPCFFMRRIVELYFLRFVRRAVLPALASSRGYFSRAFSSHCSVSACTRKRRR